MAKPLEQITCTFNIFDTGRVHGDKNRGYLLDNVKSAINSSFVQERLRMREMLGYVGHGYRELAKKLNVGEVDTARLPNGQSTVIKAIPACVCTDIRIDDEGNLTHTQEIIDNEEGKTLLGLHNSRIGGFSWAASPAGNLATMGSNTLIDGIYGFDYVVNPLFSSNRGFVLDSADDEAGEQAILDSLQAHGIEAMEARDRLSEWYASVNIEAQHYRDQTMQYMNLLAAQNANYDNLQDQHNAVANQLKAIQSQQEADKEARKQAIRELAVKSPVVIPTAVVEALIEGKDAEGIAGLLAVIGKAARIDTSTLPIGSTDPVRVPRKMIMDNADPEPMYGSVEAAADIGFYD